MAPDMSQSRLFAPLHVGKATLKHRLVMAPLTRFRSDDAHVPILPMVQTYYAQRASCPGTLLISEAILIAPQAGGYDSVPGLWTDAQCAAWKHVTDAVHAKGSFIYAQLWALGRAAAAPVLARDGFDVVSASDVPMSTSAMGDKPASPRPLTESEIWDFVGYYAQAARNAVEKAGFDGVEIHAANGYLIDQFTQTTSNTRTDAWGGSIEKRTRFALEVAAAVAAAVGPDRTGIRLSPFSTFQNMRMPDPIPTFSHLVSGLRDLKLAYLHLVESRVQGNTVTEPSGDLAFAIDIWGRTSPVFLAGGYTAEGAMERINDHIATGDSKSLANNASNSTAELAIVFGRYFISNPDLPFRVRRGIDLAPYDRRTFYKPRVEEGYTDYPFCGEWKAEAQEARL